MKILLPVTAVYVGVIYFKENFPSCQDEISTYSSLSKLDEVWPGPGMQVKGDRGRGDLARSAHR